MESKDILSNLNAEQLSAVTYMPNSILILAGAGSGKTRVLTTRIVWLIHVHNINPHNILAVTFTNKASKEMHIRIGNMLNLDTKMLWVGTFHSIALKMLYKHHKEVGLNAYFRILDMHDQLNLIKRIIKEQNLDEDHFQAKEIQKYINHNKENGIRANNLISEDLRQKYLINLYASYENICNTEQLVDFTELLLRSYELLNNNHNLLMQYQEQFQHILIDEFQDTNMLQYKWLKLLTTKKTVVFAVGDDDQSIYSFRGAQSSNLKLFLKDFKISKPICLEQNYRSTSVILKAANAIIANNYSRIGKNLWCNINHKEEKIKLYEAYTEDDEAFFVMDEIRKLISKNVPLSEIAILYRSNAQSRIFEQVFYNKGIPYKVYGGLRFFERQEIKQIIAYLRLIINPHDNDAFCKVINFPTRGIGIKALEKIHTISTANKLSLYDAINLLEGKQKILCHKFTLIIQQLQTICKHHNLEVFFNQLIEITGIKEHYSNDNKQGKERLQNISELAKAILNYNNFNDNHQTIAEFLSHSAIEPLDQEDNTQEQMVQLMTVHAAKGLEFKIVFIVGLEEGLFPHDNSLESNNNLEEERRLMYVAITRAKEQLYLLRACRRILWGKSQVAPISRFISEIPNELISNVSSISNIGCDTLSNEYLFDHPETVNFIQKNSNFECKTSHIEMLDKDLTLKIGDIIQHKKFGNGKIMQLNALGKKLSAEIFFIGLGRKTLDLNIARIEKV